MKAQVAFSLNEPADDIIHVVSVRYRPYGYNY